MNSYLLFKSLHLIAVISWMAGLLYLPRIFVYHSENHNEIVTSVFKTMERKLYYYIMTPAMMLSWIFGLILIHEIGFQQLANLWLQLKLILVLFLTFYHFYLGLLLNQFKLNQNKILLTAKEDFHIKQMASVLQDAITKRKMDIRILKPGKIEVSNNTARQEIELLEGITLSLNSIDLDIRSCLLYTSDAADE